MKHPIQPVHLDDQGVARFKENAIVRFLLDEGPFDMNRIAMRFFGDDDQQQFAQLIGYSVSDFGDLSYADPETVLAADVAVEQMMGRRPTPAEHPLAGLLKEARNLLNRVDNASPTTDVVFLDAGVAGKGWVSAAKDLRTRIDAALAATEVE